MLTDEVTATTYGNGVRVLINYGTAVYTADGVTVEAGGYRLLNPGMAMDSEAGRRAAATEERMGMDLKQSGGKRRGWT